MKLHNLATLLNAQIINCGNADLDIKGGYAGDFLSFVMGKAPADCAWFTVMSNINVAAVAYMAEVGVIVLCQSVTPDPALTERCSKEGINIIKTDLNVFEAVTKLALYEDKQ